MNSRYLHRQWLYPFTVIFTLLLLAHPSQALVIGSDGGITLWVSYDNLDAAGASVDDDVTQDNGVSPGTCTATNDARAALGEPDSPGSCPAAGGDTCTGREKLLGDIGNLAEYIYISTHGTHYLRRVYVADRGRAWTTADIKWNIGSGGSYVDPDYASGEGSWMSNNLYLHLNSSTRKCIHDVLHHEFGHYFYDLPDRYARSGSYYKGSFDDGATVFNVDVDEGDPNSVMAGNFPHRFVDTTNARLVLSYDQPGPGTTTGEELTPALLADADPNNDGPDRAHHVYTTPFAQDEWSVLPTTHIDLAGAHTEGDFSAPNLAGMPVVDVRFIGVDEPFPGTILLLDRSGSMAVQTHGIPASQYVQEAGLYLYHSSEDEDYVGTFLYNDSVEKLFDYELYDPSNQLLTANFRNPAGLTDIALALEEAIDAMIAEHGVDGVNSGQIILMSDGKQTTGDSIWDQVDRANDLGIQIHTMSFGNADTTTMDDIATNSGGSVTPMSELDSAAELKLGMARKFTTIRGKTPIYTHKGRVKANGEDKKGGYFESYFFVPPRSRDVLFYTFLEKRNAADLLIELTDSSGQRFNVTAQDLARKGRFNGIRIKGGKPGRWTFKIRGGYKLENRLPTDDNIEIVAYVGNSEIEGHSWFDNRVRGYPGIRVIKAKLDFRYPLTNLDVVAHVYDGANHIGTIALYDDGKQGMDTDAQDGTYSGILNIESLKFEDRLDSKFPRKIRVDVEFKVAKQSVPAPNAHYETGIDYEALLKDYSKLGIEPFTAYSTQITHVRPGKPRRPSIRLLDPRKPTTLKPGSKGAILVAVTNARPALDQVRVALGQGVNATVTSVDSHRRAVASVLKIVYKIDKGARQGPRTLQLQFGNDRLKLHNAVYVSGKKIFRQPRFIPPREVRPPHWMDYRLR